MTTGLFTKPGGTHSARKATASCARAIGSFRTPNHAYSLGSKAGYIRVTDKPVPLLAAYAEWLAGEERDSRGNSPVDARKIRRAVVMRRGGCSLAEIGSETGLAGSTIGRWLSRLPKELAV